MKACEIVYLAYLMCYSPELLSGVKNRKIDQNYYCYFQRENLFAVPVSACSAFYRDLLFENFSEFKQIAVQNISQANTGVEIVTTITRSNLSRWLDYLAQYTFLSLQEIQSISRDVEKIQDDYHIVRVPFSL